MPDMLRRNRRVKLFARRPGAAGNILPSRTSSVISRVPLCGMTFLATLTLVYYPWEEHEECSGCFLL
jgi:hypothetical protein